MKAVLLFLALFPATNALAFKVTVDPGHGGIDGGAVRAGLREADLVLKVALRLKERLQSEPGLEIHMTRESDQALTLEERVKLAETEGSDLFISLHANAAPDERARGLEFFFQNSLPPDEDALFLANLENQSQNLSEDIDVDPTRRGDVAAIVEDLHRQSRILSSLDFTRRLSDAWKDQKRPPAIKQAPFHVVSKTKMPSVLVEIGFLTHPSESKRLKTATYQDEIADRLKEAILEHRRKTEPNTVPAALR